MWVDRQNADASSLESLSPSAAIKTAKINGLPLDLVQLCPCTAGRSHTVPVAANIQLSVLLSRLHKLLPDSLCVNEASPMEDPFSCPQLHGKKMYMHTKEG
jgi:hypothetical protein